MARNPQQTYDRCMWWANLAGWPNGASEAAGARCVDKAFGGRVGVLQDGSSIGSKAPAQKGIYPLHMMQLVRPVPASGTIPVGAPLDMTVIPPRTGGDTPQRDPRHPWLLVFLVLIVAILIIRP
jgi:hypothetical protein